MPTLHSVARAPRYAVVAAAGLALLQACSGGPSIIPVTAAGADSLRRSSTSRVVLLNVWATWCRPCLEEMPALVRLRSEYSRADLDVILLSADDPSDADTAVAPFLAKTGVGFPTYIFGAGDQDAFINALDSSWTGALPATFLSSPSAGTSRTIVGARTYEQFRGDIDALLGR